MLSTPITSRSRMPMASSWNDIVKFRWKKSLGRIPSLNR